MPCPSLGLNSENPLPILSPTSLWLNSFLWQSNLHGEEVIALSLSGKTGYRSGAPRQSLVEVPRKEVGKITEFKRTSQSSEN